MTPEEIEVMKLLAECFNKFVALEIYHPEDQKDFMRAINSCQNIVSSRVAVRTNPDVLLKTKI